MSGIFEFRRVNSEKMVNIWSYPPPPPPSFRSTCPLPPPSAWMPNPHLSYLFKYPPPIIGMIFCKTIYPLHHLLKLTILSSISSLVSFRTMPVHVLDGHQSRIAVLAKNLSILFDILTNLFYLKFKNKNCFFKEHNHEIKHW